MPAQKKHTAGALDIRAIIAYLIGLYGLILTGMGLFAYGADEEELTGGLNVNLWAGLGLLAFAAAFLLWNKLNPVEVPDGQSDHE